VSQPAVTMSGMPTSFTAMKSVLIRVIDQLAAVLARFGNAVGATLLRRAPVYPHHLPAPSPADPSRIPAYLRRRRVHRA
jgi:hypothetical protein